MIQPKLLVVDDQQTILTVLRRVAEEIGYRVETTHDPKHFKNLVSSFAPDLILIDVIMPEEDGLQLLQYLAAQKVTTSVIVISDYGSHLLNTVAKMGSALGLNVRAVQKPMGPSGWRDLLAFAKSGTSDKEAGATAG